MQFSEYYRYRQDPVSYCFVKNKQKHKHAKREFVD